MKLAHCILWTGHDEGCCCSTGWELWYLPRIYPPCVVDRLGGYLTEIKVPGLSLVLSGDRNNSARRCAYLRGTLLWVSSAGRISLTLIGCRACVGGSVSCSDWPCSDCAVDFSPGGVWIGYIRPGLDDVSLIDAPPVTGSLVSSALFVCLDVYCTAGFSSYWTLCGTDCVLLAGCQLFLRRVSERWTMATNGAAVVEDRAGITFGVELCIPWETPDSVVDILLAGVVLLRHIPDVIGLVGRREGAAESRVLQGRDICSVRVLIPDCRGVDKNFHDVTIVDMGDVPESHISLPELSTLSQQWPPAVISRMGWRQQELDGMRALLRSGSIRVGGVVWSSVICIGTWHGFIWTWPSCGGAQYRGAPCGRARHRTAWITFVAHMMFRGRLSRPAWRSTSLHGRLHGKCGQIRWRLSTRRFRPMCSCLATSTCRNG